MVTSRKFVSSVGRAATMDVEALASARVNVESFILRLDVWREYFVPFRFDQIVL